MAKQLYRPVALEKESISQLSGVESDATDLQPSEIASAEALEPEPIAEGSAIERGVPILQGTQRLPRAMRRRLRRLNNEPNRLLNRKMRRKKKTPSDTASSVAIHLRATHSRDAELTTEQDSAVSLFHCGFHVPRTARTDGSYDCSSSRMANRDPSSSSTAEYPPSSQMATVSYAPSTARTDGSYSDRSSSRMVANVDRDASSSTIVNERGHANPENNTFQWIRPDYQPRHFLWPRNHPRRRIVLYQPRVEQPTNFKLPTIKFSEVELEQERCSVCLTGAREYKMNRRPVAKTSCGHFFCARCIYNWRKSSWTCPICRKMVLRPEDKGLRLFHIV